MHNTATRDLHSGKFIVFEGGDGAGKGTQISLLVNALNTAQHAVVTTREPGGTTFGQSIRALLLDPSSEEMNPKSEALLFAADRAHHVHTVIRPALDEGHVVVCDRYIDSSIAYQGGGRGLTHSDITDLSNWATDNLSPDLTIVLDIDPRVALTRAGTSEFGAADRIELAGTEFADAVRATYLAQATKHPERYAVIDASGTPDVVHRAVVRAVNERLSMALGPSAI